MLACSVFITFGLSQNSRDILATISYSVSIFLFKGTPITKALTCMKTYLYKQKMAILSTRPILQAILLYEQFLHLTQINLHPNT